MLTAIIVDDEKNARDVIRYSLSSFHTKKVEVVKECANVKDAVAAINDYQPDIVFLDIEMPKESGFKLLDYFEDINFEIVFITAYSDYAIKAFEVSAIDYLLKPVQIDRLESAIDKIYKRKGAGVYNNIKVLKENLSAKSLTKICISHISGQIILDSKDIIMLQADRAYCKIFLSNRKTILASKSLNKFEFLLEQSNKFFKTNRSFIVNKEFVTNYKRKECIIELEQKCTASIAKSYRKDFTFFLKSREV